MQRLAFAIGWILILFLIATNIQAGWLYVIISIFSVLLVISVIYPILCLRGISIDVLLPTFIEKDSEITAKFSLNSNTSISKYLLQIHISTDFFLEPISILIAYVKKYTTIQCSTTAKIIKRGEHTLEKVKIACAAPLGIFKTMKEIPVKKKILVHPKILPISTDFIDEHSSLETGILRTTSQVIDKREGHKLQKYLPGDSLRDIHWKVSAKKGELIIIKKDSPISAETEIVIDDIMENFDGEERIERFENTLDKGLSLAHYFIFEKGNIVTVKGLVEKSLTIHNQYEWEKVLLWFTLIKLK